MLLKYLHVFKNTWKKTTKLTIIVIKLIIFCVTVSTHNKMVLSESDTDSDDVLFEHRKSKSGSRIRNGTSRNGFIKVGSRVKT